MEEVNVQPVDLSDELPKAIEPRLAGPPIIAMPPVFHEALQGGQRHALRPVVNRLLLGPARGIQPAVEVVNVRLRDGDGEGADLRHVVKLAQVTRSSHCLALYTRLSIAIRRAQPGGISCITHSLACLASRG